MQILELRDAAGALRASGFGKGYGIQARASAIFEAIEHDTLKLFPSDVDNICAMVSMQSVAAQPPLAHNKLIQRIASRAPAAQTKCINLVSSAGDSIYWPVFLSGTSYFSQPAPGDDITSVLKPYVRYTSSVGFASGSTVEDAALHSAFEILEHDAMSEFALRTVILRESSAQLETRKFDTDLDVALVGAGADQYVLARLPSAIPSATAFAAFGNYCRGYARQYGLGASISVDHAATRAMSELLQSIKVGAVLDGVRPLERAGPSGDKWAHIQSIPEINLPTELVQEYEAPPEAGWSSESDSGRELARLETAFEEFGGMYYAVVSPVIETTKVILAVVPGMDRYDAILSGWPITPTGRLYDDFRKAIS